MLLLVILRNKKKLLLSNLFRLSFLVCERALVSILNYPSCIKPNRITVGLCFHDECCRPRRRHTAQTTICLSSHGEFRRTQICSQTVQFPSIEITVCVCVCVCKQSVLLVLFSLFFFFYISVSKSGRYSGLHHGLCETWWAAGIHFGKGVEFYSLCHFVQVTPCTNPTNSVGKRRVRTAPNIHILHCIFFALSQYSFFFSSINMDISWVGIHIVFIVVFTVTPCSLIGC